MSRYSSPPLRLFASRRNGCSNSSGLKEGLVITNACQRYLREQIRYLPVGVIRIACVQHSGPHRRHYRHHRWDPDTQTLWTEPPLPLGRN